MVNTIRQGVGLRFRRRPQLSRHPVVFTTHSALDALRSAVDRMRDLDAIRLVRDRSSPGFYSRLFTVPKRDGGIRPVIDLSPLNRQLMVPHFKMETQASIRHAVSHGDWAASIDLKDAYFHVPMAASAQRFLRFQLQDQVFQFRALPFGLSTSPREFTKVLQPVVQLLRLHGIRVHAYLDDWLILGPSLEQVTRDVTLVANLLQHLGWVINFPKSNLQPQQDFVYLGMRFWTQGSRVLVAPSSSIRDRISGWLDRLRLNPQLSARELSSLMGLLLYAAPLMPNGMRQIRSLQWAVRALWLQQHGRWTDLVPLSPSIVQQVHWFLTDNAFSGVPASPLPAQVTLFSDASRSGWGATTGSLEASGSWDSSDSSRHINQLEILAVFRALVAFRSSLAGQVVRVMIDNTTAVACLRRFGSIRSAELNRLSWQVLDLASDMGCSLHPVFLPGSRNVTADGLSRRGQTRDTEWALDPRVFRQICARWGHPEVDLMATPANRRVPRFVSPFPHPQAMATDAFALDWGQFRLAYVFPPTKLVPEVIAKFRSSPGLQLVLIAPLRANLSWVPGLMSLSRERWLLPPSSRLLSQKVLGQGLVCHPAPDRLNLHAWLL